jgi:hypothetical protein
MVAFYKVVDGEQEISQVIRKVVVGPAMCTAVQVRYSNQPVNKMSMDLVCCSSQTIVTDKSCNCSTGH